MSHNSNNDRGSQSHVRPEHHLRNRWKRWPLRLMSVGLLVVFVVQQQANDGGTVEMRPTDTTVAAAQQWPPDSLPPTTATTTVPVSRQVPDVGLPDTTVTTATTVTTLATTTTTEPMIEPVPAGVGSATAPADPIMTTVTFRFESEPQPNFPPSVLTCHADTELHVYIPVDGVEVLMNTAKRTYEVRTESAQYSAAAFGLACSLEDEVEDRGTIPDPTASELYNLRDSDGKRTELASSIMEELAVTTACVDSADVNLRAAGHELLKNAFLSANPGITPESVTVTVNPPARSVTQVTLPLAPDNPLSVVSVKCQTNA